jgi:protein gp37
MTGIQWTEETWNPTTGCDKVSPGCGLPRFDGDDTGGCYAMAMAKRLKGMGQAKYQNDGDPRTSGPGFGLTVHPDALDVPLRWREPRMVFVNSMSDLGHARVPPEFLARVWAVMAATPRHTYQILSKRPGRIAAWVNRCQQWDGYITHNGKPSPAYDGTGVIVGRPESWPLPNVHLGTTVELDRYCQRADSLRETPAAVRLLSLEPLLGPLPSLDLTGIDWAIIGGESGSGAREMDLGWARDLRDRCREAGTAVFVKQLGSRWAAKNGGHAKGGDWDRWPEDLKIREFPRTAGTVAA